MSLDGSIPLKGIIVQCSSGKKIIASGTTDESGKISFSELKEKNVTIEAFDKQERLYQEGYKYVFNSERKDIEEELKLRWVANIETQKFIERNQTYNTEPPVTDCVEETFVKPSFPDGNPAMQKFIAENLIYPSGRENSHQGRVYVSFIVEKDGTITNIKVKKSVTPELDQEAKNLTYYMSKFTPGKCGDTIIRCKVNLPINFTLE